VEPGRNAIAQGLSNVLMGVIANGGSAVIEPFSSLSAEAFPAALFVVAAEPQAASTRQRP
jgi:hypothetical protein